MQQKAGDSLTLCPQKILKSPFPWNLFRGSGISICCRLEIAQLTGYILGSRGQRKVGQKLRPASPRFRFMFWACYQSISSAWFQKWGRCHAHGDLATSLLSSPSPCCSRLHLLVCASSSFFLEVLEFCFPWFKPWIRKHMVVEYSMSCFTSL